MCCACESGAICRVPRGPFATTLTAFSFGISHWWISTLPVTRVENADPHFDYAQELPARKRLRA
jgi:hypothetical protein